MVAWFVETKVERCCCEGSRHARWRQWIAWPLDHRGEQMGRVISFPYLSFPFLSFVQEAAGSNGRLHCYPLYLLSFRTKDKGSRTKAGSSKN